MLQFDTEGTLSLWSDHTFVMATNGNVVTVRTLFIPELAGLPGRRDVMPLSFARTDRRRPSSRTETGLEGSQDPQLKDFPYARGIVMQ